MKIEAIEKLAQIGVQRKASVDGQAIFLHFSDTLIAAMIGVRLPESLKISKIVRELRSDSLGLLNLSAAIRMTEIDDIHISSGVTVSSVVVPAALCCLFKNPENHSVFMDSMSAGYQVSLRLANAMGGAKLMSKGLWPTYLIAAVGSAVTTGRFLGLSQTQMENAIALALSQTPRSVGKSQGEFPGRWFLFGQAVERGWSCANAALFHLEGDKSLLTDEWLKTIGGVDANIDALNEEVSVESISFKPFCAAKQTLSAIEGFKNILEMGIDPEEIESIEVSVPQAYAGMIDREPFSASRLASMVSVKWQLALTAYEPKHLFKIERNFDFNLKPLEKFMRQIKVKADPSLENYYPKHWPAKINVLSGSKNFESVVYSSNGDNDSHPWTISNIYEKGARFNLKSSQLQILKNSLQVLDEKYELVDLAEKLKFVLLESSLIN